MGFQDFLIDSIAHNKSPTSNSTSFTPPSSQIKEEVTEIKIIVPEPEIS